MIQIEQAKAWLRRTLIHIRSAIPAAKREKMSAAIFLRLIRQPWYAKAERIAVYIGFDSEVQTQRLIERTWRDKKNVFIPSIHHGLSKPCFKTYEQGDVLSKTKWGTWEPRKEKPCARLSELELILVPGLAFDGEGHRLGFGGGFYDRVLERTPRSTHVGLFFGQQQIHRCPRNGFDQPLQAVVTEERIFTF